jgi:hypothetical protein
VERRRGGRRDRLRVGAQAHLTSSWLPFLCQLAPRIDEAIKRVSRDARLRPIRWRSSVRTNEPTSPDFMLEVECLPFVAAA